MSVTNPRLVLHTSPFQQAGLTTPRLMLDVVYSLLPVTAAALWFFGISALLVILAGIAGALVTEYVFTTVRPKQSALLDGSALVTGLVFALTLPPCIPVWMSFLGGVVSIGLGKSIWGGLGQNLFNPALVGRAFLQAAFPTALTTWVPFGSPKDFFTLHPSTLALPFMHGSVDGVTAATPLGLMKFQHQITSSLDLFVGNTAGSLGETSAVLIILCGIYLLWRRAFDWRIPVGILASVLVLSEVLHLAAVKFPSPVFMLLSGGLLYGTLYMATDPATSPMSPLGTWIFGIGIGVLVVLIRLFGGLPEGVMYAILLMNAGTPLIERWTQHRVFGHGEKT